MFRPVPPAIAFVLAALLAPALAPAAEEIDFARDIRPILSDNCFACHGPDPKSLKGDLRLDLRETAVLTNKDGRTAIVPGSPDKSEFIRRIHLDDPEKGMPPADSHKKLTPKQKQLLSDWIKQGAKWGDHWSFGPAKLPALPKTKQQGWAINAIDHFVLAELEAKGLTPTKEANRETLIRRVSYDVTGLPPTLEEIDAFVGDKSSNAYEAMVDRMLAKKAFGERMALAWMDAARYGDTSVMHADGPRQMWAWRDWVINSYNDNMPFDRFTIEQIAGDLLPNATVWQKVASAFNRNHASSDEGGAIPEELRVDYVVDRVKTVSNVWLGLSMECGQCHDHKYDPVTQKEYYAFFAFFNQTSDPGMQTRGGNQAPIVSVPMMGAESKTAGLKAQLAKIDADTAAHAKTVEPAFTTWTAAESAKIGTDAQAALPGDMLAYFPLDNAAACAIDGKRAGKITGKPTWQAAKASGGFATNAGTFISYPADVANFDRTDKFSYGCWVKRNGDGAVIGKMNEGNGHRGWDLYLQGNGKLAMHLISKWSADAIKVGTVKSVVPKGKWAHVFVTYDGSSKVAGVKLYVNGVHQKQVKVEADGLKSTTKGKATLNIGRRTSSSQFSGLVDDVRIYGRELTGVEVARLAGGDPIRPILATAADKRTKQQVDQLRNHYLATVDKKHAALQKDRAKVVAEIAKFEKPLTTVMVMNEQPKPRATYLLMRGHYASPDREAGPIKPAVPEAFGALPEGAPQNRLGLAQWLVAPEHPLTARVTMNRYWSMLFGKGIVGTVMDFGSQGKFPTHPKLIDWLAVDFVQHKWDRKRAIKQILMSATYRQSSVTTPQLAEVDPVNDLMSRGPRFRLQGEFIRDSALAVSGLLVGEIGGAGVKPYQPPGLWNEVSINNGLRFRADTGDKLYRKSMYIYWKRSSPHPGMLLFDAPTREKCVVERARTNTPLQALYTMNGTQFIEAARMLAQRMMTEGGDSTLGRIEFAHRLTTGRRPSLTTIKVLGDLYESELSRFKAEPERAKQMLSHGEKPRDAQLDIAEHAAWTVVASAILNMDATLTRY